MLEQIERQSNGRFATGHGGTNPRRGKYITCPTCGLNFYTYSKSPQKYCSISCMATGYKLVRGNMSKAWGGGKISKNCITCQKEYMSYESLNRKFCSPKCKSGEKHPMWKDGNSRSRKTLYSTAIHRKWRKSVFERDGFICQGCKRVGGILNAHHILAFANFPDLRYEVSNGITLCLPCHKLTDNYGGKSNRRIKK